MGIASLSHLGVVALVIVIMTIAWRFQKRRATGRAFQFTAAPAASAPWTFFKAVVLLALFLGAMVPVFRTDGAAPIVHMVSTIGLAVLAGLWMFHKNGK